MYFIQHLANITQSDYIQICYSYEKVCTKSLQISCISIHIFVWSKIYCHHYFHIRCRTKIQHKPVHSYCNANVELDLIHQMSMYYRLVGFYIHHLKEKIFNRNSIEVILHANYFYFTFISQIHLPPPKLNPNWKIRIIIEISTILL